jgi:hypothetical protein
MFDPALAGYWGNADADADAAMVTALGVIAAHPDKVDGIKISLLDKDKEIAMRRRLPATGGPDGRGVRMYTGDDFNYAELIAGDGAGTSPNRGRSDALLGIFDAIAPAASAALVELVAPGTVNTMPEPTLDALVDHGEFRGDTVRSSYVDAHQVLGDLANLGVDYTDVVEVLEDEAIEKFEASWNELIDSIAAELKRLSADGT